MQQLEVQLQRLEGALVDFELDRAIDVDGLQAKIAEKEEENQRLNGENEMLQLEIAERRKVDAVAGGGTVRDNIDLAPLPEPFTCATPACEYISEILEM
jgi:hypothetical protein